MKSWFISAAKPPGNADENISAAIVQGTRPKLACSIASETSLAMKETLFSSYAAAMTPPDAADIFYAYCRPCPCL
jgi:hypothetical protein